MKLCNVKKVYFSVCEKCNGTGFFWCKKRFPWTGPGVGCVGINGLVDVDSKQSKILKANVCTYSCLLDSLLIACFYLFARVILRLVIPTYSKFIMWLNNPGLCNNSICNEN